MTAAQDATSCYAHSYLQKPPDVALINMEHHLNLADVKPVYDALLSNVLSSGKAIRQAHNTTLLWKTTTPSNESEYILRSQENTIAKQHSYVLYDVALIAQAAKEQGLSFFYWDQLHFLLVVYEQANDAYVCTKAQNRSQASGHTFR